jgi:YVTN family beta-propeller protein
LQVTRSGDRLALGGRQQRAVLALLLADAGAVVSVGRLADALWGEETPGGFVTTVQTYVFHLREVLEPARGHGAAANVLVTEPGSGYRLDTRGSSVDSAVFEGSVRVGREAMDRGAYDEASAELAGGLGLWRGEVLADLADLGFVGPIAARLEELRLVAQGLRIVAELALGRHDGALPEIDRLIADHPLREQFHAQRITALYRSGRQSDALAAYRELRGRLDEELGIEPSPPLQRLHQAVLVQDPVLDWIPPRVRESPAPDSLAVSDVDALRTPPRSPEPEPSGPRRAALRPVLSHLGDRWFRITAVATAILLVIGLTTLVTQILRSSPPSFPGNSIGSMNDDGSLGESMSVGRSPDGLAFGAGSLWAANRADGTVSRIDPETRLVLQVITVGTSPTSLTVTANDVWVTNFDSGTVSRINTVTNTAVDNIAVGNQPAAIASGPSGVWVANSGDDTVQRIDPITGRVDKAVAVGDSPDGIAVDSKAVWVCNGVDGTVLEIDPVTLQFGRSILVGGGPRGIALTADDVWVASRLSQSVTRINRATGAIRTIGVGDGPHSVQVAGNAVWVSNEYDGTISRVDPSSNEVETLPNIGASPRGLAEAGGSIWVALGAFADPGHKGGTLRVVGRAVPGGRSGVDPAAVADSTTIPVERLVYDGLVALGMSGGSDSGSLVPDLALSLPHPSNNNRTYAFTLRSGIRYSTGREVHATDFRTGVLKALTVGGNTEFYAGIVGGRNCIDHPASCDLSAGLITDDAARRVTFNLVAPDPEFLYKLTYFVYPVPPGIPATVSEVPVPGTGPYMISAYVPKRQFTLKRNPHFSQWSFAAQPAGYPDVIDFRELSGKAAADEVIAGRVDVARLAPSTAALRHDLALRYPGLFKEQVLAQTSLEYLNTRMGPFNDVRVRQALNYAVDRNRLVAIEGAETSFGVTCQVLPPNFPSHRWYCPYTTGTPDGGYHGPDLAKAQALVRLSGTRGMTVTVQGFAGDPKAGGSDHALNVYFATVLRKLGYTVKLREQAADYDILPTRRHVQITAAPGWIADYPAAANFFDGVFSCTSAVVGGSWYCNPQVERKAAEAHAAELTDPGKAGRLWAEVDRLITDDAPVVALGNSTVSRLISPRVGNYQSNALLGPLLSQLWVK